MNGAAFAAATFLGAFLLFQVQPLMGKFILPWFGGATSVWTTCMLFFQVVLLGGYAYAHALTRIKRPRVEAMVHLIVVAGALLFLPIAPSERWKPPDPSQPTWRILGLLLACLGLPYFVLASTSPLLQSWFHRILPTTSPYRLYALSNVGSLAALITFPVLFETTFSRKILSSLWSGAFLLFGILITLCAWRASRETLSVRHEGPIAQDSTRAHWLLWILLPAAGSVMLLATTNKMCQDVAVIPFLWIAPLALYLLSFIIAFDSHRWYRRGPHLIALAILNGVVCVVMFKAPLPPLLLQVGAFAALLFVYCMVCHGEVYRLKPDPRYLTGFYLCIASGGALGGVFVGLIATLIFNNYLEYHLAIVLAPLLLTFILLRDRGSWEIAAAATVVLALVLMDHARKLNKDVIARTRNFYGVLRVIEHNKGNPGAHIKRMNSGDITHGAQMVHPTLSMMPTTYYVESSGVGRVLRCLSPGNRRIGTVGLGVGTLAAYAHEGDTFRFYEINPECKRFAERHFSYLLEATGKVEVVLGDARLSMEREPPQNYDLLVLDAFSSDSIPVHLVTLEAFAIYLRHIKPAGSVAVHVSNRHLDLIPVAQNLAEHYGLHWAYIIDTSEAVAWHSTSFWMLLSRDPALLENELIRVVAQRPPKKDIRLWTDDYASMLPLLKYEAR